MPVSNKPIVQKTHKVFACLQRTDAETINRGVSTQVSQTNHKEPYKIQQGRSKSQSLPNLQAECQQKPGYTVPESRVELSLKINAFRDYTPESLTSVVQDLPEGYMEKKPQLSLEQRILN